MQILFFKNIFQQIANFLYVFFLQQKPFKH